MDQSSMWVEYLDSSSLTFHRTLQSEDPITTTFFFIFGAVILFITCSLSRSSQREQREEEERREEERRQEVENAIKAAEKRRNKLISTFCSNDLIKVLQASDFTYLSCDRQASELEDETNESSTDNIILDDDKLEREFIVSILVPEGRDEVKIDRCHSGSERIATKNDQSDIESMTIVDQSVNSERNNIAANDYEEVHLIRKNASIVIPIVCPICLEPYKEGDTVVLSGNSLCTHGFHQHCILDYLVRQEESSSPCPCCRQVFLPKETSTGRWKQSAVAITT